MSKKPAISPVEIESNVKTASGSQMRRGLRILERLAAGSETAAALARDIGVNRSTALRLLRELEELGYVSRSLDKRYTIAPQKLLALLSEGGDHPDWVDTVTPALQALRDQFHESTNFSIPAHGTMVYMAFFPSLHPVTVRERVGAVRPMHCSAIGKAYLAALAEPALKFQLDRISFTSGTERAAQNRKELRDRIAEARRWGYAVDHEETLPGVTCVAASVWVGGSVVGAAGVSAPTTRMPGKLVADCGQQLVDTFVAGGPQTLADALGR